MIKSAIALAAAAPLMAAPALAMLAPLALLTGTPRSVVPTSPLTVVMLRPFPLVRQVHPSPLRTLWVSMVKSPSSDQVLIPLIVVMAPRSVQPIRSDIINSGGLRSPYLGKVAEWLIASVLKTDVLVAPWVQIPPFPLESNSTPRPLYFPSWKWVNLRTSSVILMVLSVRR